MTTQYANASYQEIIDLHTESDSVSVVGIHTPCSDTPYHMLKGFWDQFKKFKYNGCSISLVPTAQLPLDPLQVSYDASEPTIDPRDVLNPILFHGCHGDDMGAILNSLYSEPVTTTGQLVDSEISDSIEHNIFNLTSGQYSVSEIFEQLYYRALTDKTWLKAHPQRGFRKSGLHPMIYSLASTAQLGNIENSDLYPSAIMHDDDDGDANVKKSGSMGMSADNNSTVYRLSGFGRPYFYNDSGTFSWRMPSSNSVGSFVTPRLQRLGWMDTRQVISIRRQDAPIVEDLGQSTGLDSEKAITNMYLDVAKYNKPVLTPKIFMGMIMLPPAYKTLQHFRLILNHSYSFAKFRGASMQYDNYGEVNRAYTYFNFSGTDADKKIVPPEPDPKGDEKDGTVDKE